MRKIDASHDLSPCSEFSPFRKAISFALLASSVGCSTTQAQISDPSTYPTVKVGIPHINKFPEQVADVAAQEKPETASPAIKSGCSAHEKLPAGQVSFLHAQNYSHGLAVVQDEEGFLYIDLNGNPISDDHFDYAENFVGEKALVGKGTDLFYLGRQGQRLDIPYTGPTEEPPITFNGRFEKVSEFHDGAAEAITPSSDFVFIDEAGQIQFRKNSAFVYSHFSEGLMPVFRNYDQRFLYFDKKGKIAFHRAFVRAGDFHEGLAAVCDRNDCYHIQKNGSSLYKKSFDDAGEFNGGMAPVREGKAWFHIKRDATPANDHTFAWAGPYAEDMAIVKGEDGRVFHVGRSGEPYPNRKICAD